MAIGAEPAREQLPAPSVEDGDFLRLGVEEEFHVVDLAPARARRAGAHDLLERLPDRHVLRRAAAQRGGEQHAGLHGASTRCATALVASAAAARRDRRGPASLGVVGGGHRAAGRPAPARRHPDRRATSGCSTTTSCSSASS